MRLRRKCYYFETRHSNTVSAFKYKLRDYHSLNQLRWVKGLTKMDSYCERAILNIFKLNSPQSQLWDRRMRSILWYQIIKNYITQENFNLFCWVNLIHFRANRPFWEHLYRTIVISIERLIHSWNSKRRCGEIYD